jgi:hypothetical protein
MQAPYTFPAKAQTAEASTGIADANDESEVMTRRTNNPRRLNGYALPLATALLLCIATAAGVAWLWHEYTLLALALCALALFGGDMLLPRHPSARILALGAGAGLLIGSLLALQRA